MKWNWPWNVAIRDASGQSRAVHFDQFLGISFRYATTDGITQCIRPTWIVRVILIASERNATKMTYLGICQIGCIWNARFLTVKCISFSLMHLISFAKFTSGQPHLSNCHLSNQMLLAFQMNCNWCKLYVSGQDPQFDINFACAVHFDFGRMRLRLLLTEGLKIENWPTHDRISRL